MSLPEQTARIRDALNEAYSGLILGSHLEEADRALADLERELQRLRDEANRWRLTSYVEELRAAEAELQRLRDERDARLRSSAILRRAYIERAEAAERHTQQLEQALAALRVKWGDGECFCQVRGTIGGLHHSRGCEEARAALSGRENTQ